MAMRDNPSRSESIPAAKKNSLVLPQLQWGIMLIAANVLLVLVFISFKPEAVWLWVFGLLFGFVLQRSRFCFAAAFRDVFLIRNTSLTRALILGLAVATAGFLLLEALTPGASLISAYGKVEPVGVFTAWGAFLFGLGMVIAGGCASGVLMRMGEGYLMQWTAMLGFLVGSAVGAWRLGWWMEHFIVDAGIMFFPERLGWTWTLLLQAILLGGIYFAALVFERGWKGALSSFKGKRSLNERQNEGFYKRFLKKPWPYVVGGIFLAVLNIMLFFAWGSPWGITSGITYFSGWLSSFLGFSPQNWVFFLDASFMEGIYRYEGLNALEYFDYPYIFHFMAIIIGSFLASLLAGEFRLRKWRSRRFVLSALAGGFLMGYGARLALGCNIGAFFSAIPSLSMHGWIFGLFVLLGSFVGGKILYHYLVS